MSDDPRFTAWLEVTEAALVAPPAERIEALEQAGAARADLQRSLETSPPCPPGPALARRLARAEEELASVSRELRDGMQGQIEELRRARTAAGGYKPQRPNYPAFISKSV
ncbi:MAG: hypothetical protein V3V67_16345 [Myxococcota bacterium]